MLEIPIFYFGSDRNEFDFYFSNEDPLITYDSNQEPIYSGVYFSRPGNSKSLFKLTNSNIPEEISPTHDSFIEGGFAKYLDSDSSEMELLILSLQNS